MDIAHGSIAAPWRNRPAKTCVQRLCEQIATSTRDSLDESVSAVVNSIHQWRGARGLDDDVSLTAVEIR